VPVCATIGAALVFTKPEFTLTGKIVIFICTVTVLNAFFFVSLKRTLRNQKPPNS
jgi:hypothetical protein